MMFIAKTQAELNNFLYNGLCSVREKNSAPAVGFVPTMGYLHEGHLSLIRRAKAENDLAIVSIFVNPTQFAPGEDFASYPRDIGRDCQLAARAGADIVFAPSAEEIYPAGASTSVEVRGPLTSKLCGASRPTHFKGVTTVVSILFNIVRPTRAYFGQKDAQQSLIIRKMVRDLHWPVEIIICPIVRESDGLAMSSRNVYLDPQQRQAALALNRALQSAADFLQSGQPGCDLTRNLRLMIEQQIRQEPLADIDYVQVLDGETLDDLEKISAGKPALAAVAVRFGQTRLIDNRQLQI